MKAMLRKLRCLILPHAWVETDIYHVDYSNGDYDVEIYHVVVCRHCGRRQK